MSVFGRVAVPLKSRSYDIVVGSGLLADTGKLLKDVISRPRTAVVTDANVADLYLADIAKSMNDSHIAFSEIILPPGEQTKSFDGLMELADQLLSARIERGDTIIALGGGVVSDLAGFSAATFMRGCKWASVPTSMLAMVDASIGGKTGFDLPQGKNLVGAFYPPSFVLSDPNVLTSLPARELRAGMAEVVKHGVIADKELFDLCAKGWKPVTETLAELVRRGMAVKVKVIEEDPYEQGERAALNFGHTVGHAVEVVSNFDLLHGEAIAIGMIAEARLAERLSIADDGFADTIKEVLFGLNLPVHIPENLSQDQIILAMNKDKKKSNGLVRFALPVRIGQTRIGVEINNLGSVLEERK